MAIDFNSPLSAGLYAGGGTDRSSLFTTSPAEMIQALRLGTPVQTGMQDGFTSKLNSGPSLMGGQQSFSPYGSASLGSLGYNAFDSDPLGLSGFGASGNLRLSLMDDLNSGFMGQSFGGGTGKGSKILIDLF